MRYSLGLQGDEQLRRQLLALEASVQVDLLAEATRLGSQPILQRAQELAPVDTGTLRRIGLQIKTKKRSRTRSGAKGSAVAAESYVTNTRAGAHAILQEFGVQAHRVGKRKHPGHRAQPFMRRAFVNRRDVALSTVTAKIQTAVLAAARGG